MTDEFVKALPSIVQALSIAATAYFAVRSLRAWRTQLIGKRKFEVAEEAVLAANRAREALEWIRSPAAWSGEAKDRPKDADENENQARLRDTYFVPLARIKETSEAFSELGKIKLLCKIHFGPSASDALQEFVKVRHEVAVAARMLIDHVGERGEDKKFWEGMRWKIWATEDEHDVLTPRIAAALSAIENICSDALK